MAKAKLNQIIALNAPKKADFQKFITKYYHIMQQPAPFFGLEKHYTPKDEDGVKLPSESSKVQLKVEELLTDLQKPWQDMFDVVLTNDHGNCQAKADIVIDEKVILKDVPVTTIIFLEKRLSDWQAILDKIPLLPLADEWKLNPDNGFYTTPEHQTVRTNKVEESLVLYPATPEHPAQCKSIVKDVIVGTWTQKKLSSALPMSRIEELKDRLSKLKEAVIKAREQANSIEIEQQKGGDAIVKYLFG